MEVIGLSMFAPLLYSMLNRVACLFVAAPPRYALALKLH